MSTKILIIVGTLNRGGTERHLAQTLPLLNADMFTIEVLTLSERGVLADALEAKGIRVHGPWLTSGRSRNVVYRAIRLLSVATQMWLYMVWRRPAIAHFFLPASYLVGAPVALLAGIKRRVMSRRSLNCYQLARPMAARIERKLHRFMTAILANSKSVMTQLIDEEHVDASRSAVIYNGVETPQAIRATERLQRRESLGIAPPSLVMVITANLIPYKGHADLLHACASVKSQLPRDWRLLVIGRDDGIGESLQTLCTELQITPNVVFLGERGDVSNILQVADIGLLVSHEEGFSNALLECMAAGLPSVATDVGGNAEAVRDGIDGLIVAARDVSAIGDALVKLANDSELRAAMGRTARQRAASVFAFEPCARAYERFYQAVLAGKPIATAFDGSESVSSPQKMPSQSVS